MFDIILDTLKDAIKLLPFLFVAFLIIELIEHKLSNKSKPYVCSKVPPDKLCREQNSSYYCHCGRKESGIQKQVE